MGTSDCLANCTTLEVLILLYFTLLYFTLLYFTLLYFTLRTLLPSASSGYTIGRLTFTQWFTSVIDIPISLYHLGTSLFPAISWSSLSRRPCGWITSALLWGAVGAILLTFDHHLILFLCVVCSVVACLFAA